MSWGEASSLASRTNNKQFPPSGPGTLLAPVSKPALATLLTCSSDYRWLCSQSAGCESRLGQAGWRQEVTDARQPQDQSTHWTRPADAARRIASATGPSAHHRGTPSSIIHPSLAHAARSSLSRPVSQSWRNLGERLGIIRPPYHALTTLCFSRPCFQPVFLCSLDHAPATLPGPESETEVKLDQPHCSTSGKRAHARPGLPVNHC